jgi:PiT family inorganic phosphate transporter
MTTATMILALVVVVALAFDFTNGFHDTGNAMAASIATGALSPKGAVTLAAILNLVGACSRSRSPSPSATPSSTSRTRPASLDALMGDGGAILLLLIVFGGLIGGIIWNLFTWLLGLPSSSSHALLGGLVGGTIGALGFAGVKWAGDGTKLDGVIGKVLLPSLLSTGHRDDRRGDWPPGDLHDHRQDRGQVPRAPVPLGSGRRASLVSLAHGTNDAQKTMGVITLALVATGTVDSPASTSRCG